MRSPFQEPFPAPAPSAGELRSTEDFGQINILAPVVSLAAGFCVLVWIVLDYGFWTSDGAFPTNRAILPFAAALSIIFGGCLFLSNWRKFGGWLALLLIGQAASLQLINAGNLIHFQHFRSFTEMLREFPVAFSITVLQLIIVAASLLLRRKKVGRFIEKRFNKLQIAIALGAMLVFGAAATPDANIYLRSLASAFIIQLGGIGTIVFAVSAIPKSSTDNLRIRLNSLFEPHDRNVEPAVDRFSIVCAVWIISITAFLGAVVYQTYPHVPDETQYIFQAKSIAAGQLTSAAPRVPEAFSMYMVPFRESRWFGIFPPAYPAMLAVGLKAGAVWLVNPLLAGGCVILAYLFFQEVYSRRFARIGIFLLSCSPWFIFMAMSLMSHIFALFCALSAACLVARAIRKRSMVAGLAAGLFTGIESMIRPLDGLILACLLGSWLLFARFEFLERIKLGFSLLIGTVAAGSLNFIYNYKVTGSALLLPMDSYYTKYFWAGVMSLGFGANRGMDWGLDAFPGHSPIEAAVNALLNFYLINTELFGWTAGSLLLAVLFFFSGKFARRDIWILLTGFLVVGGYSFYWYSGGPDFGARYWFLLIIPLIAATVRSIENLEQRDESDPAKSNDFDPRFLLAAVILSLAAVMVFIPWRAVDKYFRYLEIRPGIASLAEEHNFGKSLVLIRGNESPDYQAAWTQNPLNFEGESPIFAHDKEKQISEKLVAAYEDRMIWIVEGPSLTGEGFRVVSGPLRSDEYLANNGNF